MELRGLKLAIRNLIKDSNHTMINVIGLTLSISFSFLIFHFVKDQVNYDAHLPNAENIYRISSNFRLNGHQDIYSNTPRPMGKTLVDEFPSILAATKFMGYNGLQNHRGYIWYNENYVQSEHLYAADSNFLTVFELLLIEGDKSALHHPNQAIISESFARKLFGNETALGKVLKLENQSNVQVTGVFKDLPNASYIPFEVLVSYTTFFRSADSEKWWYGGHVYTYIKTTQKFRSEDVHRQWDSFFTKYMKSTFDQLNGTATIIIQPLLEIYLSKEFIWEPYPHSDFTNIRIFTSIGIFLLIVAGFNYTNLSLSHLYYRQEEMRTKRILGASKIQLVKQNFSEAILVALLVALLSVSLLGTILPAFDAFTNRRQPLELITLSNLVIIFGLSFFITLLFSIYPSIKMAARANNGNEVPQIGIRKFFVIGQLALAMVVITCTIIVINQLAHVKNMNPGFEKDNLMLVFIRDREVKRNLDAFQNEIDQLAGIVSTSRVDETPGSGANEFTYQMQNTEGEYVSTPSQTLEVGLNFIATMGIKLIAGRVFETQDDEYRGLIINEFLAQKIGIEPQEIIGTKVKFGLGDESERSIIGVVKDFRIGSAQEPDQAMTLGYRKLSSQYILARLPAENQQEVIDQMKALWASQNSTLPFQYTLVTDEFDSLLKAEDRLFKLLMVGSVLIIFIACLGLIGLVSQTIARRTKEIGIRKVVGAGSFHLYMLLQKEYMKTFLISFVLGSIAAWYIGGKWLEAYSYRIEINFLPFLIAGAISLIIVLITLSFHTINVIKSNPIDSLRDE